MNCDMCGAPGKLFKAIVEGAHFKVCHECSKFGKVTGIVEQAQVNKQTTKEHETEVMEILVGDYAEKIRKGRESLGLKQEGFAKKISEKESIVQKIESGNFEPPIGLAKKIGNFLKIKLIEEYEETHEKRSKTKTNSFTIGDMIKIKDK
jgi:putative transcription factor